jgi:Raf kinase inhibitor-like YbhB/YbcL family protein
MAFTTASLVAIALLAAGCAHDGRTLRPPAAGASAPAVPTTTVAGQTVSAPLTLTSAEFQSGGSIPLDYTCDGAGVSPPLAWGSVPEATVELALGVTDVDAGGFVHWVVAGLDPSVQALAIGVVPDGSRQAKNGAGTVGWTGPCPPKQSGPHHYVFTLYALTAASNITAEMNGHDAITAISNIPGLTATLSGVYQRA